MSKQMTVEELREKPQELIAALDKGEAVTITRDGAELGTIEPAVRTGYRGVPYPFRDLQISPLSKPLGIDAAQAIIEERERERSGK